MINDSEYEWYESDDEQKVRIYVPDQPIVIQMSAGADSSLLMFLICDYIKKHELKNVSILAMHGVDKTFFPESKKYFDEIFKQFKLNFSSIKMISWSYEHSPIANPNPPDRKLSSEELSKIKNTKIYNNRCALWKLTQKFPQFKTVYSGRTSLPPKSIRDQFKFVSELPDRISPQDDYKFDVYPKTGLGEYYLKISAKPLQNVNKLFVASIYKKNPFLIDTVYPLTYSCLTKTSPCKKCDWCKEKKWAFGTYDFGIE